MTISIATFNTAGVNFFSKNFFNKCKEVANIVHKENLDVINLQEVVLYKHLTYLTNLLPKYKYISYKPALFSPLAGLVTLSKIPLEFKEFKKFERNGDYYNFSIIHKIAKRGLLLSKLKDNNIYIINTHFSSNMSNNWDIENNYIKVLKTQTDDLYNLLNTRNIENAVITGDFNIPKSSSLYPYLTKGNLNDVFAEVYKPTHLGDIFFKKESGLQVDYVFTYNKKQNTFKVIDKSYLFDQVFHINNKETYLSDHFGLKAKVNLS